MKRPKPSPFRKDNADSGRLGPKKRVKLFGRSLDQVRRDEADKMRASKTSNKKPSSRVPFGDRKPRKGTDVIASAIMGGSKAEKAEYARKKAKDAAVKLGIKPAKKGK